MQMFSWHSLGASPLALIVCEISQCHGDHRDQMTINSQTNFMTDVGQDRPLLPAPKLAGNRGHIQVRMQGLAAHGGTGVRNKVLAYRLPKDKRQVLLGLYQDNKT